MVDEWTNAKLEDVLDYIQPTDYIVSSTEYSDEYKTPVLTAGKSFIIGYTDEGDNIFDHLPTIIFDDFTTAIQFVNFKFKVKSSAMKILVPTSRLVDIRYIFYLMKTLRVNTDTHKRYWISNFSKLPIRLAPSREQRVIADQIEELLSDLDNAIENLKKAQEQLRIYKQIVLKNAFEGKLTKEWRKKHNPKSAEEILRSLSEMKKIAHEKDVAVWMDSVKVWAEENDGTKRPLKPKLPKELPCLKKEELEALPELPMQWKWIKIDTPLEPNQHALKAGPFGSSLKKSCYVEKGYKIYGQEQVISGDPYYGDYYIPEQKYQELYNCRVKPGDVLVSLVGTAGKVLILPEDIDPGIINPRLIKMSFSSNAMLPTFFKYYFESSFSKSIYKLKAHGATMDILNVGIIQELPFPFCSLEEQEQVIAQIEARFSICDKLEESIRENLQKAETLRQSILKQAFEGNLTEQWRKKHKDLISGENSAAVLLKRIKAEKDALEVKSKGRKKHD